MAALELIQKHIRTRDMLDLSGDLARLLDQYALPHKQFRSLMYYIAQYGKNSDPEQFLHDITLKTTDNLDDVMTLAEHLRQQGMHKGIQKGIKQGIHRGLKKGILIGEQKGEQKGKRNASIEIARQLIARGIGSFGGATVYRLE